MSDADTASEPDGEQLWAGSPSDLEDKLSERYGVDEIWIKGDHYDEEADELVYDALVWWDGDDEHLITDDVPILGHGPSGAAGVREDDLPTRGDVMAVVDA